MAIIKTITYSGQNNVSTLSGDIRLEAARGRLVIYDPVSQTERVVHDISGSYYKDENGDDMTLVDTRGINTIDPATGVYRGRWGISTTDGRPFGGFSKTGNDIRTLLGE